MKKIFTLLCLTLLSVTAIAGNVYSLVVTFGSDEDRNVHSLSTATEFEGFTFKFATDWTYNQGAFLPKKYSSMSIEAPDRLITSVYFFMPQGWEFTDENTYFTDGYGREVGTFTDGKWSYENGTTKLTTSFREDGHAFTQILIEYETTESEKFVYPPTLSLPTGKVTEGSPLTITSDEGTEIHYTLDGSDPAEAPTTLSNTVALVIDSDVYIRAIAVNELGYQSNEARAEYTVTPAIPEGDAIFYESFDKSAGKGGNDGQWSGSIANSALVTDNEGWTTEKGNGADRCAKFGTGSAKGSATTPAITLVPGNTYSLTFRAAAWNTSSEKTAINLSATGATLSQSSINLVKGEWTDYVVDVTATAASATFTFEAQVTKNNRFFLDEVKLVGENGDGPNPVTVDDPTFSVPAGEVEKGTEVTVSSAEGTVIYYSIDGSDPTEALTSGEENSVVVTINEDLIIRALAVDADGNMSEEATAAYTVKQDEQPFDGKKYALVSKAEELESGKTYLVTSGDGTAVMGYLGENNYAAAVAATPDAEGQITATADMAVITIRGEEGAWSMLTSEGFLAATGTSGRLAAVATYMPTGTITFNSQKNATITLGGAEENNVLRYNSTASPNRFAAYSASGQKVVRLYKEVSSDPVVVTVDAPTFSVPAGEVEKGTEVTVSSAEGTVIYYSIDGSDPAETLAGGEENSVVVTINEDLTIRAFAMDADGNKSEEASAAYTVKKEEPKTYEGTVYAKVTRTEDVTSGQYLIVYEGDSLAFNGGLETLDAVDNGFMVTIVNDTIKADDETNAAAFIYDAEALTLTNMAGYYVGQTSDANGLKTGTRTAYENTITIADDAPDAVIVSGGAYLRFNAAANQNRFRYYSSSTYDKQKPVVLYKLVDEPAEVVGDVSGDGIVNGSDVTALYNYLMAEGDVEVVGNPDVNGDGQVNGSDVTALYNILLK